MLGSSVLRVTARPAPQQVRQRVRPVVLDRARLHVARGADLQGDPALGQEIEHGRVFHGPHAMADRALPPAPARPAARSRLRPPRPRGRSCGAPPPGLPRSGARRARPGSWPRLPRGRGPRCRGPARRGSPLQLDPPDLRPVVAGDDADELRLDGDAPPRLLQSVAGGLRHPERVEPVLLAHEVWAEAQLDVVDPVADGVLQVLPHDPPHGVVVHHHPAQQGELGEEVHEARLPLGDLHVGPQLLGRPGRQLDPVLPGEVQHGLRSGRCRPDGGAARPGDSRRACPVSSCRRSYAGFCPAEISGFVRLPERTLFLRIAARE